MKTSAESILIGRWLIMQVTMKHTMYKNTIFFYMQMLIVRKT